jgi:hypothetical protein
MPSEPPAQRRPIVQATKNAHYGWPSGVERFQGIRKAKPDRALARYCAFSHPDSTVGSGISPDRAAGATSRSRAFTAGRDLAVIERGLTQTPKAYFQLVYRIDPQKASASRRQNPPSCKAQRAFR